MIGDAEDQPSWDADRVADIIGSCGGLAAILPFRPGSQHGTSKYVLREIALGREEGLPCLVVAEPGVEQADAIRLDDVSPAVDELSEDWREPPERHYVFVATDFDMATAARNDALRQVIECVTGMPCVFGRDVGAGAVRREIANRIRGATLVIADISNGNVNSCIEAGIARGAGTTVYLIAKGPPTRPPFMFRDREIQHYADDVELIGRVHALVRPHRRRIIHAGRSS